MLTLQIGDKKLFRLKPRFAHHNNMPTSFTAVVLKTTARACYVYGHGSIDPLGCCCKCGRTLTHEGSILLGIGPECLGNWNERDEIKDNMTKDDILHIHSLIKSQKIDGWLPMSTIKEVLDTDEQVDVPDDHKMKVSTGATPPAGQINRYAKKVRIKASGEELIKIVFPYNSQDVSDVKTLAGRRFHGDNPVDKFWTCPVSIDNVEMLNKWGFVLDEHLRAYLNTRVDINTIDIQDIEHRPEIANLFPFQKQGVAFIEARKGKALIADEMGLGKTVQALGWMALHPEVKPVIIVCPSSLKVNWAREAQKWIPGCSTQILFGKSPENIKLNKNTDIFIINFDIMPDWLETLQAMKPQLIIMDEVHYTKSSKAKRTKACIKLAKTCPYVIGLSGTPIVNRPIEIFNALQMIDKTVAPDFWDYAKKYCDAKYGYNGWDFRGASNTEALHEHLVSTVMIRRKKADVLKDLPDKLWTYVPMEIDNRKEYTMAENQFRLWVAQTKGMQAAKRITTAEKLAQIEALKQLAAKGKIKQAINWIADFIDTGNKLVVFATHRMIVDRLMSEFKDVAVKIDGSVTGQKRQDAVDTFQNDPNCLLFVGNIRAAGEGITLTASSSVAFLELPWTPGSLQQAEDRCHRIGQKDTVNIYYLLAEDTIDQSISELLDAKRAVLDAVLDGEETQEESMLTALMAKYEEV